MRSILLLLCAVGVSASSLHVKVVSPAGEATLVRETMPSSFNPDSVRVLGPGSDQVIPSKTDWRAPVATVSWVSRGPGDYTISYNVETKRLVEPSMVGAGDRITFGRAGVRGKLSVGLWPYPAAIDMDGDGNLDLIIGSAGRGYNGTYLFHNIGTNAAPLFDRAQYLGPGLKELVAADFNGDGKIDLVVSGGYYNDVRKNLLSAFVKVDLPRTYWHSGRDDFWFPADWDGDGRIDLLVGPSDWRDYGWDDAYNAQGEWTRGPLHGPVYWHRNIGTNAAPKWAEPVAVEAGGRPIDQYGSPTPIAVDWSGRGRLDLLAGSFLDTVTLYRNIGKGLAAGQMIRAGGSELHMDLCMIQPRAVQWHADGRWSLLIGEEDGRIALIENRAAAGKDPDLAAPRYLEQVDPFVKSGGLARPVAVDWNGDGKLDLLAGNTAGYLQYFENVGTAAAPAFEDRGYLKAGGKTIRHLAGLNGSIQGPAERKWGYTNLSVADWDLDGKLDILVNDITGAVVWYRNIGPELAEAAPIEVEWQGKAPKPEWVWQEPKGRQLLTQWRTTPKVVDWDGDGLPDLVMLNHQGYLCLYRRARRNGALVLLPPERIFREPGGRFLNLAPSRAGASGRRKVELADWDGDGDLDLITDSDDGPVWYENIGSQAKPVMQARGRLLKEILRGHSPTPSVADWNGDGRPDLIVGGEDGFFYYFERGYIERNSRL